MRQVTIVMYHYVRELARSRYPSIKGRTVEQFVGQLDHLRSRYTVLSAEQLIGAINGGPLPDNAAVLTFDDGYLENFTVVFPILKRFGFTGLFFPPARAVLERSLLDVNKIHFALAAEGDHERISHALRGWIDDRSDEFGLQPAATYYGRLAKPSRFDSAETVFIKRMLQRDLPEAARKSAVDWLFSTYVDVSEQVLAEELYVTADQLALMAASGMYIGSHGYDHRWKNTLTRAEQEVVIDRSLEFLRGIGAQTDGWIMCYPYGAWNETLLDVLRSRGCAAGLTTRVGVANLSSDNPLLLPRLDTNDLPII